MSKPEDMTMTWQAIETAPKDETYVLISRPLWSMPVIAQWRMNYATGAECWTDADGGSYRGLYEPTHWMPLPAPPESAK